jgi:anti-sigma factor RsiW
MNQLPVTEADLHAYVDGLLSEARSEEIADYLAVRPEEQVRVGAWRAQNEGLRRLFDPVLDEPVPARLSSGLVDWSQRFGRYAAALLLALTGGVGGWTLHGAVQSNDTLTPNDIAGSIGTVPVTVSNFARQAAVAHVVYSPDARRPVEIGADQEEQLVAWLSKRLGTTMRPPQLGSLGYELIGGRLLPGDNGPVAQFMYHDAGGQRLTLYVSNKEQDGGDTGFRFAQEGLVNVFYWIDGRFGYALSAGIDKGELARVANVVYEQLEKNPR